MIGLENYIEASKSKYYQFHNSDIQSIVHLIAQHGSNLIGLELGVFEASSFCTILQNCPNIKTLYGVDSWQPYNDYLYEPYDGTTHYTVDTKSSELTKLIAYHSIKYSGFKEKAIILEKDSNLALQYIPNNSLDFIFIDTYLTYEQAINDINNWYPKVKVGGLLTGHDADSSAIKKVFLDFREKNNINSNLSIFNNTFVWKKEF